MDVPARTPKWQQWSTLCWALLCLLIATSNTAYAMADDGFQYQWEPDGWQASIRTRTPTGANQTQVFHLLYRRVDEQGDPEHDFEEAIGGGISMGNRIYFSQRPTGLFVGGRLDTLYMIYDWKDGSRKGESDVVQINPWATAGFSLDMDGFILELIAGAGYIYNTSISGDDVGSDFTFAAGGAIGFRF